MKKLATSLLIVLMFCTIALATDERFPLSNITVLSSAGVDLVQGEITNNSARRFTVATFTLNFFDENDSLIGSVLVSAQNFAVGSTVTFNVNSERTLSGWATYGVQLREGF